MKKLLLFSASALLLYTLSWIAISSLTFFSSDVGLRFLQIQELVDHRWRTFAIDYPGRMADPEMKFVPYYYAYSVVEGEMYFNISPYFPLLTSFFYAAFGSFGLPIMPVFGSLLTAWATWRLVRLSDLPHASLAFFATLFATPMLFYAIVLWDHSLGTGLATLAVAGVAVGLIEGKRHAFVLAGIAAGLAIGQRPEIYLFAAALGISLLWVSTTFREGALVDQNVGYSLPRRSVWQPTLLFAVSGLFTTGLVWWTQVLWVGHPLGMALAPHLLGYGAPTNILSSSEVPLLTKISNLLLHTEPTAAWESWATAFVLIGGILLFVLLLTKTFHNRILLLLSITFSVIGYLLFAYGVLHSALIGIIPTFTLLPFALLYVGHKRDNAPQCRPIYRLVLSTTVLFLALIMLTWPGYGGLQWGARYLLPIYPLLVYLAWVGYASITPPQPSPKWKGEASDSSRGQSSNPDLPRESSLPLFGEGWGGVMDAYPTQAK